MKQFWPLFLCASAVFRVAGNQPVAVMCDTADVLRHLQQHPLCRPFRLRVAAVYSFYVFETVRLEKLPFIPVCADKNRKRGGIMYMLAPPGAGET